MSAVVLVLAVFAACFVEAVEALTIVLAVGLTRGWRSTVAGIVAALAALAVTVAALGPTLRLIPLDTLRVVIGGLLLVFGLQWLRKAILRAAGLKAVHDEDAIYRREAEEARRVGDSGRPGLDGYAVTIAFKGVLLEGLEVVFIVLTFGANQGNILLAVLGAVAAVGCVTAAGAVLRAPLAKVPENSLKYAVGLLLTTFGIFWGAEGAGAAWPGGDAAILAILGVATLTALAVTGLLRRRVPGEGTGASRVADRSATGTGGVVG